MATPNGSIPPVSSQENTQSWILQREQKITPDMTFAEAGRLWLESIAPVAADGSRIGGYIRSTTKRDYERKLRSVCLFFGTMRLCEIRLDHLTAYQRARAEGAEPFIRRRHPYDKEPRPCPAKPEQVNKELTHVVRILKETGLWGEQLKDLYRELREEIPEIPRALTPEEQLRWLKTARSHPRWNLVYWWSLLAFDTCMSTNEIRGLRLGDINLQQRMVRVPVEASKNAHRHRDIEIAGEDAIWALEQLVARAHRLGARDPQHYLFPFIVTRSKHSFADRHMTESGLKKLWEEVRQASGLIWFRMYDTRHTAITRLAEAGVPIMVIMKRAGHVSMRMTEHYTHISDRTQVDEVRRAQRYNGGLGTQGQDGFAYSQPPTRYAPPPPVPVDPGALIGQMLRTLQEQCGVTAEQLREILLAQTSQPSPAPAVPSNVIGFRPR